MSAGRRFRASPSLPCINMPVIIGLYGAKGARQMLHVSYNIVQLYKLLTCHNIGSSGSCQSEGI